MNSMLIWVAIAAFAGALAALVLGFIAWRVWGKPQLDAEMLTMQDQFEQRVRAGVLKAGEELLPALREQVRLGFTDALKSSHAAGIAEGTAKIVAGSTDLLVDSLSNLFGLKKK